MATYWGVEGIIREHRIQNECAQWTSLHTKPEWQNEKGRRKRKKQCAPPKQGKRVQRFSQTLKPLRQSILTAQPPRERKRKYTSLFSWTSRVGKSCESSVQISWDFNQSQKITVQILRDLIQTSWHLGPSHWHIGPKPNGFVAKCSGTWGIWHSLGKPSWHSLCLLGMYMLVWGRIRLQSLVPDTTLRKKQSISHLNIRCLIILPSNRWEGSIEEWAQWILIHFHKEVGETGCTVEEKSKRPHGRAGENRGRAFPDFSNMNVVWTASQHL